MSGDESCAGIARVRRPGPNSALSTQDFPCAGIHAEPLKRLYIQATRLAQQFSQVEFVAIPRDLNRLADALAWEALNGRQWLEQIRQ